MLKQKIVVIGGGTFNHVRAHCAIAAPAFGESAKQIAAHLINATDKYDVQLMLTKMADSSSSIITNDDLSAYIDELIADQSVRAIVFNAAVADFTGQIGDVPASKYAERLKTSDGPVTIVATPADKIVSRIRKLRKDIFAVSFKTTANAHPDDQYSTALKALKTAGVNLTFANDLVTRRNMIVTPEESRYCDGYNRGQAITFMCKMLLSRIENTFTRSTVIDGQPIDWNSDQVPDSLRTVVNHCISRGAYKPVLGKTAGHFAAKVGPNQFLTSIRKSNFNHLDTTGLVLIESSGEDTVIAHGARPSVGGQSQRIIFNDHRADQLDCIVHFHSPMIDDPTLYVSTAEQWMHECGSHQCGRNTSNGLRKHDLGDGHSLHAVFLQNHGPNIVFNRDTPAAKVIAFIDHHFDMSQKTGGMVL